MAKKQKTKAANKRARNLVSGAVLLVPAMLAAATAFVNAASTNKNGLRGILDDVKGSVGGDSSSDSSSGSSSRSKGRKRSRKSASAS